MHHDFIVRRIGEPTRLLSIEGDSLETSRWMWGANVTAVFSIQYAKLSYCFFLIILFGQNKDRVYYYVRNIPILLLLSCRTGGGAVIPERQMTALVGPSGSGKTTMVNLISRFWDVDEGEILFGGQPVKGCKTGQLLRNVSMVFQEVYLFNDTVANNNIRVGRSGASLDSVRDAARQACCHEFIEELPNGYDTVLAEGGASLSGGEKQRISIARAILKDAPVVMLDEATASLDPENEAEIQEAFDNLVKSKTVIVIAHRFQTIMNADQILVLDKGKIVQQGRHEELVDQEGLYGRFWQEQQRARGWKMRA